MRGEIFLSPNVDPLLVLAYPENLRSIGLMVEAVDTFVVRCGTGAGARSDDTENLSLFALS